VPTAHWKPAKKQGCDNNAGEVRISTTFNDATVGLGAATVASSGTICGNSDNRRWTIRGENASSTS